MQVATYAMLAVLFGFVLWLWWAGVNPYDGEE